MSNALEIFGRKCGMGLEPIIVAELSGNHGGRIETALQMIEAAAKAGADAVKIQSYTPDTITIDHDGPGFVLTEGLWKGRTLYDLYKEAHTPFEWHPELFAKAKQLGVPLFSSPFDETAVDMLEKLNCPAYKIASFEIVDIPLIEKVAFTGKPVIMSTGIADLNEIEEAVTAFNHINGHGELILLHCTSGYPVPLEEAHLGDIKVLKEKFNLNIGLSDHTIGCVAAIASIALGVCLVEKHFMYSKELGGVDSAFSLDTSEFENLTKSCKSIYSALTKSDFETTPTERIHEKNRRSLFVVEDIKKGEVFTDKNIRSIRPGYGLSPKYKQSILGKVSRKEMNKGTPLNFADVESIEC